MVRFANLDREYGLPEGTLDSVWAQETDRGRNNRESSAGARGHFQFMPATRADMMSRHGIDPWSNDPEVGARAAGIYLQGEMRRFNGDLRKALAAYNAGGGNVNRAVREGGSNWLSRLRPETRDYVPEILARIGTTPDEMDSEEAFTRRYTAGQTTAEENETHARRRRELLENAGVDPSNMGIDMLLGKMFFALIGSFIERAASEQRGNGAAPAAPANETQGQDVPNGTNVSPNVPVAANRAPQRNAAPTPA